MKDPFTMVREQIEQKERDLFAEEPPGFRLKIARLRRLRAMLPGMGPQAWERMLQKPVQNGSTD